MSHRTLTARRVVVFAAIAALAPVVGLRAAGAAPVTDCSTSDVAFCASYSIDIDAAGTSTPTTVAATPADFTFGFANTSEGHATDTSEWLSSVELALAEGLGTVATPSSELDSNLLVAGSSAACGTNAGDFTSCTAGHGTFFANVTGTGSSDGIYPGTFGIERIVNSHATSGAGIDWNMTFAFCLNTGTNTCNAGTPKQQTLQVTSTAAAAGLVVLPTSTSFDVPISSGTAHVDTAIDSMQGVHLLGRSSTLSSGAAAPSGTQTVMHLPQFCGSANTSAVLTDRASDSVTIPATIGVTGCPTAAATSTSQPTSKVRFDGSSATTPLAPNRSITTWEWFFGDGHKTVTSTPNVTHTYQSSQDHTVALIVGDSAGALSLPVTLTLKGAKVTLTASHSSIRRGHQSKLSGHLVRWHTTTGIAGVKVSILKCNSHGTACRTITTRTTSSTGSFTVKVKPSHTAVYQARFVHNGYIGTLAKRKVKVTS